MNKSFIVAAIETSDPFFDKRSPDLNKDLPIELAAVKVKDGKIVDTFSSFIGGEKGGNRGIYLDEYVSERTGITDVHLLNAPSARKVFAAFKEFVGDKKIIVRNIADRRALANFIPKYCGGIENEIVSIYEDALACGNTALVEKLKTQSWDDIFEDEGIVHTRKDSLSFCISLAQLLTSDIDSAAP